MTRLIHAAILTVLGSLAASAHETLTVHSHPQGVETVSSQALIALSAGVGILVLIVLMTGLRRSGRGE